MGFYLKHNPVFLFFYLLLHFLIKMLYLIIMCSCFSVYRKFRCDDVQCAFHNFYVENCLEQHISAHIVEFEMTTLLCSKTVPWKALFKSTKNNMNYIGTASLNDGHTLIRESLYSSVKCSIVKTSKCGKPLNSFPLTLIIKYAKMILLTF